MKKVAFIVICCILASIFATLVVMLAISGGNLFIFKPNDKLSDDEFFLKFNYSKGTESFTSQDIYIETNLDVDINVSGGGANDMVELSYLVYAKLDIEQPYDCVNISIFKDSANKDGELKNDQKINLILPQNYQDTVSIFCENSDVKVSNTNVGNIRVDVKNGAVEVKNIWCNGEVEVEADSGDVELYNITSKYLNTDVLYGAVQCDEINVPVVTIISYYGGVVCGAINGSVFEVETDTGNVKCDSLTAQTVLFTTNNGSIDCHIYGVKENFTIDIETNLDNCNVSEQTRLIDYYLSINNRSGTTNITFSD